MMANKQLQYRFPGILIIIWVVGLVFLVSACQNLSPQTGSDDSSPTGLIYADFPTEIDPTARYLFYLHGKIIEDQGQPAISPEYGEYLYPEILEELKGHGFLVISQQRPFDTDAFEYAKKIKIQIDTLLFAGVPANQITIVGASKGAAITIYVSDLMGNRDLNYVLLAICHPDTIDQLSKDGFYLSGNVLSIYDVQDQYAGSCLDYFDKSLNEGLANHAEIPIALDLGHGLLYQPYQEWILPTVKWARGSQ